MEKNLSASASKILFPINNGNEALYFSSRSASSLTYPTPHQNDLQANGGRDATLGETDPKYIDYSYDRIVDREGSGLNAHEIKAALSQSFFLNLSFKIPTSVQSEATCDLFAGSAGNF